jgi:hypothetical protein
MDALEQVSIKKNCDIQFRQGGNSDLLSPTQAT